MRNSTGFRHRGCQPVAPVTPRFLQPGAGESRAVESAEQRSRTLAGEGPRWLVKLPITVDEGASSLPGDVEVQTFEARDELSIFMPGRSSMAKYATALSRLFTHPLDAAHVDVSRLRQVLHDDGVETAAAIRRLDEPSAPR